MEKLRVLFIITSLDAGGIENYLLRYLKFDNTITPFVLSKSGRGGELMEKYAKQIGSENVILKKVGFFNPLNWWGLRRLIRRLEVAAVCDFTGNFAGIPLRAARRAGVRTRIAFYRGSTNRFDETASKLLYNEYSHNLTKRHATKILSNSLAAFDFFFPTREPDDLRYEVIYNSIGSTFGSQKWSNAEVRKELGISRNKFVVGHVGRYDRSKNHETIMKVAVELCRKDPDICFVLAGKGTDEALLPLIDKAGLNTQIKVLGYRRDAARVMSCMDLFYFPSVTEGQPNALIEAMVSGLPVIASDIDPVRETVPEYLFPLLVKPMDWQTAVRRIESYREYPHLMAEAMAVEWARERYQSDFWFVQFRNRLYGIETETN